MDFDEFIEYYNSFMDRLNTGAVKDSIEVEVKKVEAKHSAVDDETSFKGPRPPVESAVCPA